MRAFLDQIIENQERPTIKASLKASFKVSLNVIDGRDLRYDRARKSSIGGRDLGGKVNFNTKG